MIILCPEGRGIMIWVLAFRFFIEIGDFTIYLEFEVCWAGIAIGFWAFVGLGSAEGLRTGGLVVCELVFIEFLLLEESFYDKLGALLLSQSGTVAELI